MPPIDSSIETVREIQLCTGLDVKEDMAETGRLGDADNLQFPEGGTAAWCTVIGGALVQACGFGYVGSFGVYQDFYTRDYLTGQSSSAISWIGGTNAFLALVLGIIAGALYDRGYFYHLLIGGSILESFALFMLSLTKPGQYYQIFLTQGVGLGIAQGVLYVPVMAVTSHYFYKRRTLAMSLVTSGSSVGSIIHPIMLNNLFSHSIGFANGVRISAAFVSILLLVACLLIRTRLESPKKSANYLSVGKGAAKDVPFVIMCIGLLLFNFAFYFPMFYFQLDSIQHGNSETFSFYSLVLLNGGSLIGRLSTGFIAPYVGVVKFMIIATGIGGILILSMISLSSVTSVVALGLIYGYFAGLYIALLSPLIAFLTTNLPELGARMGICMTILGVGSLLGGPVSGALLTPQYRWWRPALFNGLIALTGCALLIVMQLVLIRRQKRSAEKQELDENARTKVYTT